MKKLIVKCRVELTDVYDDSFESDPSIEHVQKVLNTFLHGCMSDKGTVVLQDVKVMYEVLNNADD